MGASAGLLLFFAGWSSGNHRQGLLYILTNADQPLGRLPRQVTCLRSPIPCDYSTQEWYRSVLAVIQPGKEQYKAGREELDTLATISRFHRRGTLEPCSTQCVSGSEDR